MLVLFDVDKTLFLSSDPLMGRATTDAIAAVWGLKVPGDGIRGVNHAGQTATRIAREILRLEGLSDEEIDPRLDRWCEEASARYLELLEDADTSDWRAPEVAFGSDLDGADAVIERMAELPAALERLSAAT